MGSYLFELTGRLSETNHVYEAFNLFQPDLVRRVHRDYLEAGAQCLKTNTFGANCEQLAVHGMEDRVAELNRIGVELVRQSDKTYREQRGTDQPVFALASIGPLEEPSTDTARLKAAYGEQIRGLLEAGPDALLLETFRSLPHLLALIDLIRTYDDIPPLIAELSLDTAGSPELDPADFLVTMAKAGVAVAGVNCCAPWDATRFVTVARETDLVREGRIRLVVMPNAGGFQRIGNRFMTTVNSEFAGRMARQFMDQGVRLIGGCCEMHPPHIREMHNYIRSRVVAGKAVHVTTPAESASAGDEAKILNGSFSRKIKEGAFAVSIEILPPRGTDQGVSERKAAFVGQLAESGLADALDITDGSRGIPLMPPSEFVHFIRARLGWTEATGDGLEMIPHFTGRDLNTMGIQSRLIGYHANRIRNVLFITGDPPKMSPTYPRSTAVFDMDSVSMIRMTHTCLNAGLDFGGSPLSRQVASGTRFTIGTGFEPESLDPEREMERLEQKLEAGADYVLTQPAFSHEPLARLDAIRNRCPVLVGVMLLKSFDQASRVAKVPGVVLPDSILDRLHGGATPEDQARIGKEIAVEQIRWVAAEGWAGLYLMAPSGVGGIIDTLRAGLG